MAWLGQPSAMPDQSVRHLERASGYNASAMTRIELTSKVGPDGILTLKLPLGIAEANADVLVTVETADGEPRSPDAQRAWEELVRSTAGSISDPTFLRHDQGDYDRREPLP